MIDPQNLLAAARDLANFDPRRPRQASLRRAVSTAYYSVFHLLIRDAVSAHVGFGPTRTHREIGETVARWFTHARMADVCAQFAGPAVSSKLRRALPKTAGAASSVAVSSSLQSVARAFIQLQQARHDADYDLSKGFTRQSALTLVDQAEQALNNWSASATDPFRPVFLLLLLTGDTLIKER